MPKESLRDPREVLAHQKYFNLRPQPLEQWIWRQSLPPSAERVFWLHWQEGMRSRTWSSEIPMKRVAALCGLDVSSVTRAYQALSKHGLIRRQDPGRDPSRPFEQAVAFTEVRVPRGLLQELDRHPNRASPAVSPANEPLPVHPEVIAAEPTYAPPLAEPTRDAWMALSGRERMQALAAILSRFSSNERYQYFQALRTQQGHITFDADSKLSAEERGRVLQFLRASAPVPPATAPAPGNGQTAAAAGPRKLTIFELARLRRELHQLEGMERGALLMREVVWSVEEGALRRFTTLHAVRIALKKIREGAWSRPNRMPPNWSRELSRPETCKSA